MKPYIKNLGKISITVDKDYYNAAKEYDRLVIVEKENDGTYISRQAVPANTSITDREYWIPLVTINGSFDYMIETTTEELRILKANGNLIPGMNYMITDYNPTVTGTVRIAEETLNISNQLYLNDNTQVAPFDIVLTALSTTDISEKGLAVGKHYTNREARQRYNGYWHNTNFTAWKLNVIVDTDDDRRPTWCQEEDAPVWISYMKDEWGNEAPFDFKTYGISLPDDVTIDETYNAEELDNNNVWLKGNRWHIFTYYDNDFAYDSSLEGYVKNVKVTDWNIIIGGIVNSEIEGDANILINSNDIDDELCSNVRIVGYGNRMFGSAPDYGDGNIIQGNRNIVVLSTVITEKYNNDCIIKDCEDVYLGEYNDTIAIRNCSNINIGNNNYRWDIIHADNVNIGNNNNSEDRTNTITNYNNESAKDTNDNVANINIGDNNLDIYLQIASNITIGNKNHDIYFEQQDDASSIYDVKIGNNNSAIQLITDDDVYKVIIENNNAGLNLGIARNVTIKNNNSDINLGENITNIGQLTINNNCSHIIIRQVSTQYGETVNAVVLDGTNGNSESINLSPDTDGYTQILTYNRGWEKIDKSVWLNMD